MQHYNDALITNIREFEENFDDIIKENEQDEDLYDDDLKNRKLYRLFLNLNNDSSDFIYMEFVEISEFIDNTSVIFNVINYHFNEKVNLILDKGDKSDDIKRFLLYISKQSVELDNFAGIVKNHGIWKIQNEKGETLGAFCFTTRYFFNSAMMH